MTLELPDSPAFISPDLQMCVTISDLFGGDQAQSVMYVGSALYQLIYTLNLLDDFSVFHWTPFLSTHSEPAQISSFLQRFFFLLL